LLALPAQHILGVQMTPPPEPTVPDSEMPG
jgi:hypothetical protein